MRFRLFCLLFTALTLPSLLSAQTTGSISGVVSDPTGAVVADAKVTVTNSGTNFTRTVTSNASGAYTVTNLAPGVYTVVVEKPGFSPVRYGNTTLTVAQALTLDVSLSVGKEETTVEVNGATVAPIETESTQLSTLIDSKAILDLPLLTRNPYELVLLSPGTNQTNDNTNGGGFSVNGSRDRNNNFMLDGVDNNDTGVPGAPSGVITINPDSTQEFRVITNNFNAEYGRNTGAIVDIITRSGTNQFHGDAYWFGRYNALGARSFFNRAPDPQDPYVRNQFGFSVGGPIKKDRTFFFINNEYERYRTTLTESSIVPTAALRSGLFTTPDGQTVDVRTATSPGNLTGMGLDPQMTQAFNLLPLPNGGDVIPGLTGLLNFASPDNLNQYNWTGKIDHKISDKHQLSLRYVYNDFDDSNPFHSETAPGLDAFGSRGFDHGISAGLTSTLRNTLINDFKFGWNHLNQTFASNCAKLMDPITGTDAFGYGRDFTSDGSLGVGPLSTIGCNALFDSAGQAGYRGTTSYADVVTWVHGNHTFKFGGDFRYVSSTGYNNFNSRDDLSFNVFQFTGQPAAAIDDTNLQDTIQNIQDLTWMLVGGTVTQFQAQFFNKSGTRVATDNKTFIQHEYDGFVQDSWKVRSNFTLNLGLRYQFDGVPFEKNANFSNLLTNANQPGPFDITVVGPGTGHMMYNNDFKDIEPRIGFAWDPFKNGKTSIRAAYGIFHDRIFDNLFGNARSNPPFQGVVSNFFGNPAAPETLPFGVSAPPSTHFVEGEFAGPLTLLDQNIKMPASQNWNFGIQRELPGNVVVEANYVGAHATHVIRSLDAVPPDPTLTQQAITDCVNVGICSPGDPDGFVSGPSLYTGITDNAGNLVVPPSIRSTALQSFGFFPPTNITQTNSDAFYHSLQAQLRKQFSHGLTLGAAYTWSHAIDDGNDPLTPESRAGSFPIDSFNPNVTNRGNSDNDIRQRLVTNFLYQFPFGKGQTYLSGGVLGRVLEGIQLSGIITAQTGHPYGVFFVGDNGRNGMGSGGVSFPDMLGPDPYASNGAPRINAAGNVRTGASNEAAFSHNFLGHLGNEGRNQLYGPHYTNADFSLSKNVSITERVKLQIRSEFYNLFNIPQFAQPHTLVGTSTLGYSTVTLTHSDGTTSARQIQLALKLNF